ncbi:MAG TPA: SDR family NAD(P)-dependent oxidoreductase [Solirubrobacteraceae bacterium]|nr:SDR family NAD(P)-dependent oxidoreductase [Solirubrobacteraceae bacterium]
MGRLDGKVALISGTAGGMGRAAAVVFAGQGARVFGCDVNAELQAETDAMVRAAGGEIGSLAPVDLSTAAGAQAWVDAAVDRYGRVDVLYNNASRLRLGTFGEQSFADWEFTIDNELHLPFHCTRAAWPHLIAAGGGVVINVGSVAAVRGAAFVGMSAHGAAKAACVSFTRHLCAAGADHGIRAVAVSPGMIRTPATQPHFDDPANPTEMLAAMTPSRRTGEPEDVARVAAFLASDDASYINGANIMVDGGVSAMAG